MPDRQVAQQLWDDATKRCLVCASDIANELLPALVIGHNTREHLGEIEEVVKKMRENITQMRGALAILEADSS